jgi:putative colanic acid biosynthesis UDP-glucose lipid carrier transferase
MQNSNITAALARLRSLPLNVSLCPARIPSVAFLKVKVVGHHIFLKVLKSPLSGWARVVKRLEDILIGGALLIFFMPLMLSIAIAIKCDSRGPVLFVQRRYGFNNERISVLKFRTMKHDESADASVPQAVRNDPRVTRLGRLLRATSLDELPQLFNVLWGDMSLVGPRPHALAHNEMYGAIIDGYLGRHKVRPGITGWAQINGWRGPTETVEKMKARVEHDLYYIENWSLLLDFKILAQTLFKGFVHPNAL